MGQEEISNFLKKYKDNWFSTRQIANHLCATKDSVCNGLKKMRKYSEVRTRIRRIQFAKHQRDVVFYKYKP